MTTHFKNLADESVITKQIGEKLTTWYQTHKRQLPWRDRLDDAYAIWISEIMLQQTTVSAVIGFYNRWMERFPTVYSLANASLDDVLKYWAGLGYYARARNLKKAAEEIVQRFGGKLPQTVQELRSLPGIGRYTAGAIASIAYGLDCPIVDANVIRVLARVFALKGDPKTSKVLLKDLWSIAEATIPPGRARDYNQAMMELGALVCTPASPSCSICPLQTVCTGYETGDPTTFPEFRESKKWLDVVHAACLIEQNGRLLVVQRPLDQLWGGLWELPRVAVLDGELPEQAALRAVQETVGLYAFDPCAFGTVKHVVTNRRVTLLGYRAKWNGSDKLDAMSCLQYAWVEMTELDNYALSSPQKELIGKLQTRTLFDDDQSL